TGRDGRAGLPGAAGTEPSATGAAPGAAADGEVGGAAGIGATGTRTTVPQAQPASGAGQASCRPQTSHRTSTQDASQVRCSISTGTPPRSTGRVSGAPQAHGKVGGVKAF